MDILDTCFVIAARNPKALAQFYAKANKVEIIEGNGPNHFLVPVNNGDITIQFYRPSQHRDFPRNGRAVSLCFKGKAVLDPFPDVINWSNELRELGGSIVESPTNQSFGAEAWISDPEGNQFLILVPILSRREDL